VPIVLHLRPGAREWFFRWLRENHPALAEPYEELYGRRAYAPKAYQARISGQVRELAQRYGIGQSRGGPARRGERDGNADRGAPREPLPPPPTPPATGENAARWPGS
jgi:hypothetical protein